MRIERSTFTFVLELSCWTFYGLTISTYCFQNLTWTSVFLHWMISLTTLGAIKIKLKTANKFQARREGTSFRLSLPSRRKIPTQALYPATSVGARARSRPSPPSQGRREAIWHNPPYLHSPQLSSFFHQRRCLYLSSRGNLFFLFSFWSCRPHFVLQGETSYFYLWS